MIAACVQAGFREPVFEEIDSGFRVTLFSQAPTATAGAASEPQPAIAAPVGRLISSDSIPIGGFTPGAVLADRYRIIGLIGRGGMGEVYRADDLKLGQEESLRFSILLLESLVHFS